MIVKDGLELVSSDDRVNYKVTAALLLLLPSIGVVMNLIIQEWGY